MVWRFAFFVVLFSGVAFTENLPAELTVKVFTGKAMSQAVSKAFEKPVGPKVLQLQPGSMAIAKQCVIPIREMKAGDGRLMDPMGVPAPDRQIDAMAKPAPIQPCHFNIPAK